MHAVGGSRFIVVGAFQLLNAVEARHHFRLEDAECDLVFLVPPQPRAAAETRWLIEATGWSNVRELGPPATSLAQWARRVRGARSLREESSDLDRLFLGDYQNQIGLHAAHGLPAGAELVALDEGMATVRINAYRRARAAGERRPQLQPNVRRAELEAQRLAARLLGLRLGDPERLTSFSIYAIDPAPGDRLERNTYSWLRGRFPVPDVVDGTLFLGSPLVESGILTDALYETLLRRLRDVAGDHLWYRPHPREHPDRIAQLVRQVGVEVLELDTVVEYGLFESGWVPANVVANHSTTLDTLRVLLAGSVSVRSVPIPLEHVPRRWKPFVTMAYGDLDTRMGAPVERLELL